MRHVTCSKSNQKGCTKIRQSHIPLVLLGVLCAWVFLREVGLSMSHADYVLMPRVHGSISNPSNHLDADKLIVMVVTGRAHHQDRLVPILESWARWLPPERLIIISDSEDASLRTRLAPGTDGGHGPSQAKWFYGALEVLNVLRGGVSAEWICVVDDDTFLFVPNLLKLLSTLHPEVRAYYGEMCSATECDGPCVCGGGGWVAPVRVFVDMATAFEDYGAWPPPCCTEMYCSDQIISKWMNQVGNVTMTRRTEFKPFPPDLYLDGDKMQQHLPQHLLAGPEQWGSVVTFHYVGSRLYGTSNDITMSLLYNLGKSFTSAELPMHKVNSGES